MDANLGLSTILAPPPQTGDKSQERDGDGDVRRERPDNEWQDWRVMVADKEPAQLQHNGCGCNLSFTHHNTLSHQRHISPIFNTVPLQQPP